MVWLTRRRKDERGATLVIMTFSLVVMLGFSALVIDLGAARQMKRQSANSADASSLGGAQDLPDLTLVSNQVKTLAEDNFDIPVADWTSCTDSDALPIQRNDKDGTDCISYDTSFTQVRVKIPDTVHDTFFANVIGFDTVTVNAGAIAQRTTAGLGSVQPFVMLAGAGGGNGHLCFKSGPGGHAASQPPCDGPDTGNFGFLDIRMYGNEALGTTARCGNSDQQGRMINNIALGADHPFSIWASTDVDDECWNPGPNTLEVRTGNVPNFLDNGLIKEQAGSGAVDDGGPARLQRGSYPKRSVAGRQLDNKPLWEFIGTGLSDVPDSCRRSVFDNALTDGDPDDQPQLRTLLETCFSDYNDSAIIPVAGCTGQCTGELFTSNTSTESPVDLYDIQLSPRFAYVPQVWEAVFPTGTSGPVHVAAFRAIFIQRVFAGCNAISCNVDFEPGVGTSALGAQKDKAEAMTGFVFNAHMLPGDLGTQPFGVGTNQYIQLVK